MNHKGTKDTKKSMENIFKGEAVISIKNLNHYFGKGQLRKQVLFNINLEINRGEIIIMTGPSGSGKTTLLTLAGGLRSATDGSLRVLGQELSGASPSQLTQARRNNGYIFQAHNLHGSLTALQNVRMGLEIHPGITPSEMIARSTAMLETVGLGQRVNYYPDDLSGGQKQRVAIARALVGQPKIVLADEPTAALDKKSGRDVVELMQKLAREQGCTILLVTHDNRILDIADRIIYMEDGHLVSDGSNNASSEEASHELVTDGEQDYQDLKLELEKEYNNLIDFNVIPMTPRVVEIFGTNKPFKVLLRPDNYIGFISKEFSLEDLKPYFRQS